MCRRFAVSPNVLDTCPQARPGCRACARYKAVGVLQRADSIQIRSFLTGPRIVEVFDRLAVIERSFRPHALADVVVCRHVRRRGDPAERQVAVPSRGGMLLGVAIGTVLGLTVVDNVAIGGGIGMIFGIVIGSSGQRSTRSRSVSRSINSNLEDLDSGRRSPVTIVHEPAKPAVAWSQVSTTISIRDAREGS